MKLASRFWSNLSSRQFSQLSVSPDIAQVRAVLFGGGNGQLGNYLRDVGAGGQLRELARA